MNKGSSVPPQGKDSFNTRIGQILFHYKKSSTPGADVRLPSACSLQRTADGFLPAVFSFLPAFFLAAFLSLPPDTHAQEYVWPTDASRLITSSFGEYRSTHIHAGLDVKTWGTEGWRVFAVDAGSVVRIEVSPYGYGRCLVIRLANGMKVLYAHLSRFSETIESIVRKEQKRVGRFGIGMDLEPGFLPVAKGETVAYTGNSGAGGGPHLHFETWDRDGNALNPLMLGFPIKDMIPPVLKSIAFTPLGYGSHVEGDLEPKIVPLQRIARGVYRLNPVIRAWGNIGLELSSYDMADGVACRFAPYEVKLYVDEKPVFSSRYDRFPQSITRQIHLERDYGLDLAGRGIFQKLFVDEGNSLPFYDSATVGSGELCCWNAAAPEPEAPRNAASLADTVSGPCVLAPGEHTIRIEAVDYFGNLAFATGRMKMAPLSEVAPVVRFPGRAWSGGMPGKMLLPKARIEKEFKEGYLCFRILYDVPVAEIPGLSVEWNGWSKASVTLQPKSPKEFIGVLPLDESSTGIMTTELKFASETGMEKTVFDTLQVCQITPEYGGTLVSPDGLCRIIFPPGSVYKPVWGTVRMEPSTAKAFGLGIQYRVEPEDIPLRDKVRVVFDVGGVYGEERNTGVYGMRRYGGFSYLENPRENGWLSAWASALTRFTVLVDTDPPSLFGVSPASKARLCGRKPLIRIRFADRLSGIGDEDNYEVLLDGSRLVMEYNPKKGSAFHQIDEPLAPGRHVLDVRVQDRAGNAATERREFHIE
jgi:hypothetical protein